MVVAPYPHDVSKSRISIDLDAVHRDAAALCCPTEVNADKLLPNSGRVWPHIVLDHAPVRDAA
jgi:hypothetical protein